MGSFLKLILGIVFILISVLWLVHIVFYMLPISWGAKQIAGWSGFNGILEGLTFPGFPFFGIIIYTIISTYFLIVTVYGVFDMNDRLARWDKCCKCPVPVYKMEWQGTLTNALLFNTAV